MIQNIHLVIFSHQYPDVFIGVLVLTRRNLITMLMSIELILNSVNINGCF
jgi:NADH:ubiquinone oxidoreductase subunit K